MEGIDDGVIDFDRIGASQEAAAMERQWLAEQGLDGRTPDKLLGLAKRAQQVSRAFLQERLLSVVRHNLAIADERFEAAIEGLPEMQVLDMCTDNRLRHLRQNS